MKKYVLKKWYKGKDHRQFKYPDDIDEELVPMLDVINNLPGIRTNCCCCGHGHPCWYMTFSTTSDFMRNVVFNYFLDAVPDDQLTEYGKMLKVKFKYKVEDFDNRPNGYADYNVIPEKHFGIYCDELGIATEKERHAEYMRICEFFSSFMPYKVWTAVQQF